MITLRALSRGWADLFRARIFNLVLIGIALTIGLFITLQTGIFWLARALIPGGISLPWIGPIDAGNLLSWGTLALFPLMGFFLMAPVAAGFCGVFAERVSQAVEEVHFPHVVPSPPDFLDGLLESLALIGAVIVVAILSLLATPVLGPLAPVLFYGLNGWLLGREFFQMAARRHLNAAEAAELRRRNMARITITGVIIAFLLTVPVFNIVVPLLSAATFTHLFHLSRENTYRTVQAPRD